DADHCCGRRRMLKIGPSRADPIIGEGLSGAHTCPLQAIINIAKTCLSLITIIWFALLSGPPQCDAQAPPSHCDIRLCPGTCPPVKTAYSLRAARSVIVVNAASAAQLTTFLQA
ncbi:hypothetical protein FOZ63_019529, partial [Perkinsus olseni]